MPEAVAGLAVITSGRTAAELKQPNPETPVATGSLFVTPALAELPPASRCAGRIRLAAIE